MKIKMITCAVTIDLMKYNANSIFTVGEDISKEMAQSFVDAKFAIEIAEEKVATARKPKVVKDEV